MPARQVMKRPRRKVSVGDLRDRVIVHLTSIAPARGGGTSKLFTPIATLSMKVETLGQTAHGFNSVNIREQPTHRFTTRWRTDINAELFLEFNGNHHEILELENLEGRNEYLVMKCRVTGAVEKEASAA